MDKKSDVDVPSTFLTPSGSYLLRFGGGYCVYNRQFNIQYLAHAIYASHRGVIAEHTGSLDIVIGNTPMTSNKVIRKHCAPGISRLGSAYNFAYTEFCTDGASYIDHNCHKQTNNKLPVYLVVFVTTHACGTKMSLE